MSNAWHYVNKADQQRIKCSCGQPAEVCEHAGLSFWYFCVAHGVDRGFKDSLVDRQPFVNQIAALTLYEEECGLCGKPSDKPNPKCDQHEPHVPSDSDDAAQTLNSFIKQARELGRKEPHA